MILCSGHLSPVRGSRFHWGHLSFGWDQRTPRKGRLVGRQEENGFIRGVEVGFGLRVTEVPPLS